MKLHTLVGLTMLAAASMAATPPGLVATQPQAISRPWPDIARQLQSADFNAREAGQKELDKATTPDLPALRNLADKEEDAEVKARLLARIEAIQEDLAINPPPISIDVKNATLTEVVAALNKAMSTHLGVWPEDENFRRGMRFTLSAKDKSFAEILLLLSRQNGIRLQSFGQNDIKLTVEGPAVRNAVVAGPVLIFPASIVRSRAIDLQAPPDETGGPESTTLSAFVLLDPRVRVARASSPQFLKLVDESGMVLYNEQDRGERGMSQGATMMVHSGLSATLRQRPPEAKKIASATGILRFSVPVREDRIEIEDAEKKVGQSFPCGGRTFKIQQFQVQNQIINFQLEIPQPGAVARLVGANRSPAHIEFLDATDKVVWSGDFDGGVGGGTGGTFTPPVKITVSFATKLKDVMLPFELKDIPLP